ncbi:MAG: ABC transporter ATP-binding protein [Halobacteria archaeon]
MGKVDVRALDGVSVEVRRGEFVALMGPSGSGKTTLLNQVGLMDAPTSGSILVEGIETSRMNEAQRADLRLRRMGYIFQFFSLFNELTALENVTLPAMLASTPPEETRQRGAELLALVGLGERMGHRPTELSGGQQQRVAIARALMNRPRILLADEPTANLDSKTSDEILDVFRELNRKLGVTIFMVTHEPELGRKADRIIKLRDGRVEGEESPS